MVIKKTVAFSAVFLVLGNIPSGSAQTGQAPISREVVQAVPSQEVGRLNDALQRLARNSRNLSALTDAGSAALELGDLDAALGFFGRAQELSPNNPSVKMGLAAVFLRSDQPIEALRLFSEAEAAGASSNSVSAERGLAFDLVGNNAEAQASYAIALARGAGSEVNRRLAISHAISGNREDFEITIQPLVAQRDFAAFRARAFGLAILGDTDEANAIADAVMPRDLAVRLAPYLSYMPRLTKAQQAAAANLGIFPKAAEIGRDDPRIARYAGSGNLASAAGADARLAPQGEPLGRAETDVRRRRPDRTGSSSTPTVASAVTAPTQTPTKASAPTSSLVVSEPVQFASAAEIAAKSAPGQSVNTPDANTPVELVSNEIVQTVPKPATAKVTEQAVQIAPSTEEGAATALASAAPATIVGPPTTPASTTPAPTTTAPVVQSIPTPRARVADAFADFTSARRTSVPTAAGAVDISSIAIPREEAEIEEVKPKAEKKIESEPAKPDHPKRYWVQIATGRDRAALKFDWRRIARKSVEHLDKYNPHAAKWGETNRLLAGPVASSKQAKALVVSLKEKGVDSFTFTSPEGKIVDKIQ